MNIIDIISVPLGALLRLCYDILGNYALAIIVFTLLTKVILLPVSMWVQKNGIAMVKLTPEINRLKLNTTVIRTLLLKKHKHFIKESTITLSQALYLCLFSLLCLLVLSVQ